MGRKEDDIFKKLNKQKPLVKQRSLQPLSPRDFSSSKNTFDMTMETKTARKAPQNIQPGRLMNAPSKPSLRNKAGRGAELASRYNQRQASPSADRRDMSAFGEAVNDKSLGRPGQKKAAASPTAQKGARKPSAPAHEATVPESAESMQIHVRKTAGRRQDAPAAPAAPRSVSKPAASGRTKAKPGQRPDSSLDIFSEHGGQTAVPREEAYGQAMPSYIPGLQGSELAPDTNTGAELTFRHELKYYINYRDYMLLKSTLKPLLSLDRYAGADGDYHIRSLYFDDAYETALVEKMAGSDVRNKYRIRIYGFSDNVIKFEKKMKQGQYIAKTSLLISRDEYDALMAGDCGFLADRREPLAAEIFIQMKNNLLTPRVIVDYTREAYVSPYENVRITFDKQLKAGLWLEDIFNPNAPTMPVLEPGTMVLEVKFNRYLPVFIKSVLNNVDAAQRSAVSKYVLCRKFE